MSNITALRRAQKAEVMTNQVLVALLKSLLISFARGADLNSSFERTQFASIIHAAAEEAAAEILGGSL